MTFSFVATSLSVNLLISIVSAFIIIFLLENNQVSEVVKKVYNNYIVTGFKSSLEFLSDVIDNIMQYNKGDMIIYNPAGYHSPNTIKIGRYVVNVTHCFITEYKKDGKVNQFFYKNI